MKTSLYSCEIIKSTGCYEIRALLRTATDELPCKIAIAKQQ
jgi:hypothetical protein